MEPHILQKGAYAHGCTHNDGSPVPKKAYSKSISSSPRCFPAFGTVYVAMSALRFSATPRPLKKTAIWMQQCALPIGLQKSTEQNRERHRTSHGGIHSKNERPNGISMK